MTKIRDIIHHPRLVQLFDYWNAIRGDRPMPARRDMDPVDIPTLLANIVLLDVEHTPLRFRVRVHGTAVTKSRGADLTKHYLDEFNDSPALQIYAEANRKITQTKSPHFLCAPYPDKSSQPSYFQRLGLPFSNDGSRVDMILVGFFRDSGTLEEGLAENRTLEA
jgi:hypothetical protein